MTVRYEQNLSLWARQTGLTPADFSEDCPYLLERILDEDWLPE